MIRTLTAPNYQLAPIILITALKHLFQFKPLRRTPMILRNTTAEQWCHCMSEINWAVLSQKARDEDGLLMQRTLLSLLSI